MPLPRVRVWALVALGLSLASWSAEAGRRSTQTKPVSLMGRPVRSVVLPGGVGGPVCKLGEHGPVFQSENVIYFDEDDTYFTYLNVTTDSCATCTTGTYAQVLTAHMALYFPFAPETLRVRVNVVGVVPIACRFQDPSVIFCNPFEVELSSQDSLVTVDFEMPFPGECQIRTPPFGPGRAFMGINFLTANDTTQVHKPQLALQQLGRLCTSFNPVGFENLDFVANYAVGNPVMYVDVAQCPLTPTRRKTWGQLKMIYR